MSLVLDLVTWADDNNINLDNAQMNPSSTYDHDFGYCIEFRQDRESRLNFQNIKRAISDFERQGDPPHVELIRYLEFENAISPRVSGPDDREIGYSDRLLPEVKKRVSRTVRFTWRGAFTCEQVGKPQYNCSSAGFADDEQP